MVKILKYDNPDHKTKQIDVELQTKGLALAGSPMAHLTEISVLFGITGNQLQCSRSKEPMERGGGGVTYDMLFLKPGYHHHLVKMFYTSSKIILNLTSIY